MKKVLLAASVALLLAAWLCPVMAETPAKLDKVAPAEALAKEADAKIAALEKYLESEDSFKEKKTKGIPVDASVLAILAQALAEHPEKSAWKGSAADVRDAAIKLSNAGSYDDAKKALADVKAAAGGKAGGAKAEQEWNKIAKLRNVMSEVSARQGKLRKATRSASDESLTEASRDASVLAVLALVAHSDTHEVKKPADVAEWQKFSLAMQEASTEMADVLKAKDAAKSKTAFTKLGKTCADCHEKYKP